MANVVATVANTCRNGKRRLQFLGFQGKHLRLVAGVWRIMLVFIWVDVYLIQDDLWFDFGWGDNLFVAVFVIVLVMVAELVMVWP